MLRASTAAASGVVAGSVAALGRAGEQQVDRVGDQLDVAVLLGGDVGDQVVERPHLAAAAEVERLEGVVHQGGHLAELAAEQLLHGRGRVWRRVCRVRVSSVWSLSKRVIMGLTRLLESEPGLHESRWQHRHGRDQALQDCKYMPRGDVHL